MTKSQANKIAAALKNARHVLLTGHRDPDGDSIGCQFAFYEYWTKQKKKRADVVNHGILPRKYACLDPNSLNQAPTSIERRPKWDAVIVFECSSLERIGAVKDLVPNGIPLINIDHHHHNANFGTVNVIDRGAAACGEMVYDLLHLWKARVTPAIAKQLAAAILTDTGRFHYRSTTPRTLEITADLMRRGANLTSLTDDIYFSYPPRQFHLMQEVLGNAQMRAGGQICFLVLREADRKRFGIPLRELEGLVDYTLYLRGVRVGALLKELTGGKTKVSLRSTDSINVAEIARRFGGGGHPNAAGLLLDMPIAKAIPALARAIGPLPATKGKRRGT
jgi:phosphoesterase RecJ-like protein